MMKKFSSDPQNGVKVAFKLSSGDKMDNIFSPSATVKVNSSFNGLLGCLSIVECVGHVSVCAEQR